MNTELCNEIKISSEFDSWISMVTEILSLPYSEFESGGELTGNMSLIFGSWLVWLFTKVLFVCCGFFQIWTQLLFGHVCFAHSFCSTTIMTFPNAGVGHLPLSLNIFMVLCFVYLRLTILPEMFILMSIHVLHIPLITRYSECYCGQYFDKGGSNDNWGTYLRDIRYRN